MPAMRWLGRKWRIGADDFVFSSVLYASLLVVTGVMIAVRVSTAGHNYLQQCTDAPVGWGRSMMGLLCVSLASAVLWVCTAVFSARGAVFEMSKRKAVPMLLYVDMAAMLCLGVLGLISAKYAIYDGHAAFCVRASTRHLLRGAIVLDLVLFAISLFSLLIAYDPGGSQVLRNNSDYAHVWWKRFRLCCCRCGEEEERDDAYTDLAQVLAAAFRGYDIVPSDIAAGMFLLHGYQERSRRLLSSQVSYPPNPEGYTECVSSQARFAVRLTAHQLTLTHELQQYSRFYMAAYGWLLFTFQHFFTGAPRLCCYDPFMCCRGRPGKHVYQNCYCDVTALLHETRVPEEDVLYTNWTNDVCQPVHYVAFDRSSDALVIAIRGSMSLRDCVTDFAATPEVITLDGTDGALPASEYYVHGGMLRSARYVLEHLRLQGILQMMLRGRYAEKKIVVLGHSLGAGVGIILSAILWSDNPAFRGRLRCLAYSPPGGTVSRAVMEYQRDFVVGTSLGYDMIPRLAQHTFDYFREAIFDVLAASSMNKNIIFLNILRTSAIVTSFHPSTAGSTPTHLSIEGASYRESLRHSPCVPAKEAPKLFSCLTTIHLMRTVRVRLSTPCGVCRGPEAEEYFIPIIRGPEEVQVIMSSPTMFTDHFPDRYYRIIQKCIEQLDRGELDRFYVDALPAADPALQEAAPMDIRAATAKIDGINSASYGATA